MTDKTDMISRAAAIAANPIETAPKDGTMLRLLVDYTDEGENPLEDEHQAWTIGFNQLSDTEEDVWEFAGWSWEQDCFTAGVGKVIGWLPFHAMSPAQVAVKPLAFDIARKIAELTEWLQESPDNVHFLPVDDVQAFLDLTAKLIPTPPAVSDDVAALEAEIARLTDLCACDCDNDDCLRCAHYPTILEQKSAALAKLKGGV